MVDFSHSVDVFSWCNSIAASAGRLPRRGLVVSLLLLWGLQASAANFPSDLKWRTLKSAHFNIIYAEPDKVLAESYAAAAEHAYAELAPLFKETPSTPIPILISDGTDLANGSATFLPYPLIIAYPALPSGTDSISHYENWVYELMIHELTHLFNMEPAHSFYKPFSYLFGTIVRPNAVLPRWYLEGLAVEVESRFSTHGRLRSPSTAAAFRAISLADRWPKESLDQINESGIPSWPFGQRPYLYGSFLWHSFTEDFGVEAIAELNQRFSRRVPFFINQPFLDRDGQSLPERWRSVRTTINEQSLAQIEVLKNSGEMPQTPFKDDKSQMFAPAVSPNGEHLIYLSTPKFESSTLQLMTRPLPVATSFTAESSHRLIETRGTTRLAWLPDSSGFVFDQLATYRRYYNYRDLYILRLDKKDSPERLTFGIRATEPNVSPTGQEIVFVRLRAGATEVVLMDLQKRSFRSLFKPRVGLRISQPTFVDARTIVVIGRDSTGNDRIYSLDTRTLKRTPFSNFAKTISHIKQTPLGLLASANATGVSNLYLVRDGGRSVQAISNSVTEILQGDFDDFKKEVIFSQLSGEGPKLLSTPLKNYRPPQIAPLEVQTFKNETAPRSSLRLSKVDAKDEEYSPARYLVPRYWIPFIYPVEKGILFQGSNETSDPTGRHAYGISGSFDSVTDQFSYGARYVNATTPIDLGFTAAETNELLAADSDRLTTRQLGVDGSFFLAGLTNAWYGQLGIDHFDSEIPSTTGVRELERLGFSGKLGYRSSEANIVKPDWGESFFSVRHTSYAGGNDRIAYEKTSGNAGLRWRGPFPPRHNLLAQIKGSSAPNLGLNNLVVFGDRTIGGNYLVSLINSNFLLRGYPSGALVGRTLVNTNLEYRFPVTDIYRGKNTFPLFFRNIDMGVFFDAALVDGAYFSPDDLRFHRSRTDDIFSGTGLEFTVNGTAAYHLPVSLTLGLYYGLNDKAGGGFIPFLSLGYVGHGGVDKSAETSTRLRPASLAR